MSNRSLVALEPAYVLHHYPYRDSSLLLEVFTNEGTGTLVVADTKALSAAEQGAQ